MAHPRRRNGANEFRAGVTGALLVMIGAAVGLARHAEPVREAGRRIAALPALSAESGSWSAAVALRDGARHAIAGATGETLVD